MFKELLLQFIISLLPVFAFQLWHNFNRKWQAIPSFLGFFSLCSMLLCLLVTIDIHGYEPGFWFIPYIVGTLYGGVYAFTLLSILYVCFGFYLMDSNFDVVALAFFMLVVLPTMLYALRHFPASPTLKKKQRLVMLLMSEMLIYYGVNLWGYFLSREVQWSVSLIVSFVVALGGSIAAVWISIFIIESLLENRHLHYEVQRVSTSYRYEVEKLQQFIDETKFGVVIVNQHGRITHINDMGFQLYRDKSNIHDRLAIVGESFTSFFNEERQSADIRLLQAALQGSKLQLDPAVDEGRTLIKAAFDIRNLQNGYISGAAIIVQDVTELTLLRDEVGRMERLSLIGQMAASITHEIRNPMAVIRGFIQLMRERSPNEHQQYYQIVMEELDRTNIIINDFLSLAQNRALTMHSCSLHDIILEMVPLLQADANMRGQIIVVELCDYIPHIMLNDKEIKQLLLNLSRNAMEAMGDTGKLTIHTSYNDERKHIELRIKDNGVGISQDQMKHLFEPFFTTKSTGTGLGLPLCLSIAERHNGRIEVESEEGDGTTFIVTFNVKAA